TAADLAAAAHHAAGEGKDYSRHAPHGRDRRFRRRQRRRLTLAHDQEVAAGDSLGGAEEVLANELAVHDRHAPEAAPLHLLAELPAVAKEAQVAADADRLFLDDRQAVVAGGGRAGEDTLADAVDDRLLQRVAAEGEQQQADARPAVGRLVRRKVLLDAGLGVA